jgi:acetyl-CoA carboxylase biotin carboxylase subunit
MTTAACNLAKAVNYRSAGTIEFVVDAASGEFFFIEMNTRIQVEHPVTEAITGVDLVKLQLRIASGERLPMKQSDVSFRGHAIECRINAEDSEKGFMPQPGKVTELQLPAGPGVRVDTHVYPSYELPTYYDSLLAKLIVWDENRDAAIARMQRALAELHISGVKTTREFHQRLLAEPAFALADISTQFVKEKMYAQHPMRHML